MTEADITAADSVLLTGPTRGLGRALVDVLARRRPAPSLLLAGRDPVTVGEVVGAARSAGARDVSSLAVDLASLHSVSAAAGTVVGQVAAGRRPPLTAVVANAGLQVTDRRHRSADGYELTFAVNVLAQHLLLRRLLPALAPGAHVVLLGSGTHWGGRRSWGLVAPPRWEDPADLAVARGVARHLAALALGETHGDLRGGYVEIAKVTRSSPASYNVGRADRLWDVAEELTAATTTA